MSEVMSCPHCRGQMTVRPELYGQVVMCPHCRQEVFIPQPAWDLPTSGPQTVVGRRSRTYRKLGEPGTDRDKRAGTGLVLGICGTAVIVVLGSWFFLGSDAAGRPFEDWLVAGAIWGAAMIGAVCGLLPLLVGCAKKTRALAVVGFVASLIGGVAFGIFAALPVAILFTVIIAARRGDA